MTASRTGTARSLGSATHPESGGRGNGKAGAPRVLESLASLSFAIHTAVDARGLTSAVASHFLDISGADQLILFCFDAETGEMEGESFVRGANAPTARSRLAPHGEGFLPRVLAHEGLVVEGFHAGSSDRLPWPALEPRARMGVSLHAGTTLLGVLVLGFAKPIRLRDRRRRLLLFLAGQVALALDRIRAWEEIEARRREAESAHDALRHAEASQSDLISIVSHELRTPLTSIKAYTETLLDNLGRPTFAMEPQFLGIINEECDRLTRIVNDVLDLSRMTSGRRRLRPESVAVGDLVEEARLSVQPQLAQKSIHLNFTGEPDLPRIEVDADLAKQALINLIANAAKFSFPATSVTVRASRHGERMRIAIEDRGPGIPSDKLPRIFERFYRVEGDCERIPGTGLGLAIVKSVAELHGGAVRAESVVGQGSRFVLDLPLAQRGFRLLIESLSTFFSSPQRAALLQSCVDMVAEVLEARIVSLLLFTDEGVELRIGAAHGLDAGTVASTRIRVGDSIAGWVAQSGEPLLVRDIESDRRFRRLNHPQYETKSLLSVPFAVAGEVVGVINVSSRRDGLPFDADDLRLLDVVVDRLQHLVDRVRRPDSIEDLDAAIASLRAVIRARRLRVLPSSARGARLAAGLGARLGLTEEEIGVLAYVARVHDVGMLYVGEDLLESDARLGEKDVRSLESHPASTVQTMRPLEIGTRPMEIILTHHEHFDGSGYPRGLKGEAIPLAARILAVTDAFEAMTEGRPYRDPIGEEAAMMELERCAGRQFDPQVVDAFRRILDEERSSREPGAGRAPDHAGIRP